MGDEPTGNLDSYNSENVFRIFKRLKEEEGLSLLIVAHDEYFAKRTDYVIQMEDGKIIVRPFKMVFEQKIKLGF